MEELLHYLVLYLLQLLINDAKRSVIVGGWSVLENNENIKKLSQKISVAIFTSFKDKRVMNGNYSLYVGGHGKIGTLASGKITNSSDLLIIIGCFCSNNINLLNGPAVQIYIDSLIIGKKTLLI